MLQPGDEIDVWEVEARLGSGGMGSVYRCRNRRAHRILAAIKVLDSAFRKHPEAEARFIREAEILFGLDHPNIVKVRNIRTDADIAFLEMEFVEGVSLEDRLQEGPLPLGEALDVLVQLADALAYLHDRGIRHRDLKPANVLMRPDGRATLVDFGLAVEADQSRITQANTTFGTVSYAPPEWIDPARLDPVRWDLYALGVIGFELLTGEVAFPMSDLGSARQQAMQVILAKQQADPLDPGPGAPDGLRALIRALTEVDPERRPSSAADVRERLRDVAATVPPDAAARPTSGQRERPAATWTLQQTGPHSVPAAPAAPPARRRLLPVLLVAGAGLLALGAVSVVGLGAAIAMTWPGTPAPRVLQVGWAAPGVDPATPAAVRVGDAVYAGTVADGVALPAGPAGEVALAWVVGPACTAASCLCGEGPCEGQCPPSCATGAAVAERVAGEGPQPFSVAVPPPTGTVRARLDGASSAVFRVGDREWTGGEVVIDGLPPGVHPLQVVAGTCADAQLDCAATGDCPTGCSARRAEIEVPWTGAATAVIDLPAPAEPPPTGRRIVPGEVIDRVRTLVSPRGRAGRVTNGDLAAWLRQNPSYQADAARSAGRAGAV